MQSSVLKSGRIYNIYSVNVGDVNNPPNDCLVATVRAENDDHFRQQTNYKGSIVDKHANSVQAEVKPVSAEQFSSFVSEMGLDPKKVQGFKEGQVPSPKPIPEPYRTTQTQIGEMHENDELKNKAVNEFKLILAKHYANQKDEKTKIAAQSIGAFLIRLWPGLKEDLEKAKESLKNDDFML